MYQGTGSRLIFTSFSFVFLFLGSSFCVILSAFLLNVPFSIIKG